MKRPSQNLSFANRRGSGFTLLELMVSMSVLAIIMALVFQMLGSTQKAWKASKARTSVFREAREAFEAMTRKLSMATLNTYWDYELTSSGVPSSYEKKSDLHFVCAPTSDLPLGGGTAGNRPGHAVFFQAPAGFSVEKDYQPFPELLNIFGYFVQFDEGLSEIPNFVPGSDAGLKRFRLMEFRPPAEDIAMFESNINDGVANVDKWFKGRIDGERKIRYTRPVAENILLLVIEPKKAVAETRRQTNTLAPKYAYDSRAEDTGRGEDDPLWKHVLPPILDVTMVAMDEASAARYEQINGEGSLDDLDLSSLFKRTSQYETDLETLDTTLAEAKIDYRIFRETVAIKGSSWEAQVSLP